MKLALLVSLVLCAVGVTAAASPAAQRGGMPCEPKISKIKGLSAVQACGPATVTMKVNGTTYSFRNGLCTTSGSTGFVLQLGTLVVLDHAHNGGFPHINLFGEGSTADLTAISGGRNIIPGSLTTVTLKGAGKNTGTFVNRSPTPQISGSWNCHGVIYKGLG